MSSPSFPDGLLDGPSPAVNGLLAEARLVDHHVHSIVPGRLSPDAFTSMASESGRPAAAAAAGLDTQLGIAVRRWCAPLLGLAPSAPAGDYLAHRAGLANEGVAAILLPAAGLEALLVDTGYRGSDLLGPDALSALAGVPVRAVVRLEALAEEVIASGVAADAYPAAFRDALARAAAGAVGLKTIAAYRFGLDLEPGPPSDDEVRVAAGAWLAAIGASGRVRLADPTLLRFGVWEGVRTGLPLQVHAGYGDSDLDLGRANPLLLTEFLRRTEGACPVLLLHNYPFHREAGYLAQMFAHVHLDVGLAVNHVGAAAPRVIAESLELAPLAKVLYSSDAWGIPELHLLGSWLFRRGLARVLGGWVAGGDWSAADAARAVRLIASENARRVYGLG